MFLNDLLQGSMLYLSVCGSSNLLVEFQLCAIVFWVVCVPTLFTVPSDLFFPGHCKAALSNLLQTTAILCKNVLVRT